MPEVTDPPENDAATGLVPELSFDAAPDHAQAVVLVLHGGRSRSVAPTRANQLAVLRMRPFGTSLARAGAAHGLAVARLRFRMRGWNGDDRSPVADATWALDQVTQRWGGVPVGLVGHSMGGRTALYAGGHPSVRSVVGLAPWLEPGDPVGQLAGRQVLIVHGDSDRMTSPPQSLRFEQELVGVAASAGYVSLHGAKHAMLNHPGRWHQLATGFTLAALLGVPPAETVGDDVANILLAAAAGPAPVVV